MYISIVVYYLKQALDQSVLRLKPLYLKVMKMGLAVIVYYWVLTNVKVDVIEFWRRSISLSEVSSLVEQRSIKRSNNNNNNRVSLASFSYTWEKTQWSDTPLNSKFIDSAHSHVPETYFTIPMATDNHIPV